ncbi:FAD-dependent oxidoreductase [Roseburia hominis]
MEEHMTEEYDVVIVGAGLAGLSCAYRLSAKGKKVLVLEQHTYAGGRTSSFVDRKEETGDVDTREGRAEEGMLVESGLHRYIGYYSALPALLRKCGVRLRDMVTWEETAEILVAKQIREKGRYEGKKVVLGLAPVFGPWKTLRGVLGNQDALGVRDKLSLVPFFLSGFSGYVCSKKLDRYTVAEYADRHHVTKRAQRLILEPLSTGIFFLPPEQYSAYVFFGLFAPAIPKFYKMRIGAYLGGMTKVMCDPIVRKVEELGGEFRFGETIERVLVEQGRVTGVVSKSGQKYRAGNTVVAATLPAAKEILEPLKEYGELRDFFRLPCMSSVTVQMELDMPVSCKDITTFGPGTDMASFAEQSRSTFRGKAGRLSVILGNPENYVDKSAEELLDVVVGQMELLGVHLKGHVLDARKVAEKNDFYSLAKGNQHLRPKQDTGIPGLVLAGDYTLTSSFATMEGAVKSGKKAAKVCLKREKACL